MGFLIQVFFAFIGLIILIKLLPIFLLLIPAAVVLWVLGTVLGVVFYPLLMLIFGLWVLSRLIRVF